MIKYAVDVSGNWYAFTDLPVTYLSEAGSSREEVTKRLISLFPNEIKRLEKCLSNDKMGHREVECCWDTINALKQFLHQHSLGANAL